MQSRGKVGLRRLFEDWLSLLVHAQPTLPFTQLFPFPTGSPNPGQRGYNMCFRWGFSYLPPECTSAMFSVCADTSCANSRSQLVPLNFTRKRKLLKQLTLALTKKQILYFHHYALPLTSFYGIRTSLEEHTAEAEHESSLSSLTYLFYLLLKLVQVSRRHFIMTQTLSAYKDDNNTASSLLWLTQPMLSFWLASLSCSSGLLNITHQRRLKLG